MKMRKQNVWVLFILFYSYKLKEFDRCFSYHLWAGNGRNLEILAFVMKQLFLKTQLLVEPCSKVYFFFRKKKSFKMHRAALKKGMRQGKSSQLCNKQIYDLGKFLLTSKSRPKSAGAQSPQPLHLSLNWEQEFKRKLSLFSPRRSHEEC